LTTAGLRPDLVAEASRGRQHSPRGRDRLRRTRRLAEINLAGSNPPSVPDTFAAVLARDSVGRALIALTPEQRTVVVLRFWRDLSLEQIADRLEWPLGTVKSRLHYALVALRQQLERDDREVDR